MVTDVSAAGLGCCAEAVMVNAARPMAAAKKREFRIKTSIAPLRAAHSLRHLEIDAGLFRIPARRTGNHRLGLRLPGGAGGGPGGGGGAEKVSGLRPEHSCRPPSS